MARDNHDRVVVWQNVHVLVSERPEESDGYRHEVPEKGLVLGDLEHAGVIDLTHDESDVETDYGEDFDMEDVLGITEATLGDGSGVGHDQVDSSEIGTAISFEVNPELAQVEALMSTLSSGSIRRSDLRGVVDVGKATLDQKAADFSTWRVRREKSGREKGEKRVSKEEFRRERAARRAVAGNAVPSTRQFLLWEDDPAL
ncbi:hypothetical protein EJ03DRAFT_371972 [Teratosphaeria nubilosa]|uniref:Uncharacterized protein n=1 Tax=Teratosphaeria nubilosa TaxID=161662 RepID=A0A6G1LJP5_9PEZI|nr:hypothetical protein EJ03DRAFT_371972 [Teratosphaeria nubilosa]